MTASRDDEREGLVKRLRQHISSCGTEGAIRESVVLIREAADFLSRKPQVQVSEDAVQIALQLRDEADAGEWTDVSGPAWTLGFGFACNLIGKRLLVAKKLEGRK